LETGCGLLRDVLRPRSSHPHTGREAPCKASTDSRAAGTPTDLVERDGCGIAPCLASHVFTISRLVYPGFIHVKRISQFRIMSSHFHHLSAITSVLFPCRWLRLSGMDRNRDLDWWVVERNTYPCCPVEAQVDVWMGLFSGSRPLPQRHKHERGLYLVCTYFEVCKTPWKLIDLLQGMSRGDRWLTITVP
jgi:hypothetical protein